jgi:hypothetical protein
MKTNVGKIDKVLRIIIGLVAAYFAYKGFSPFAGNIGNYVLWAVAVIMLGTSAMGSCPLYSIFGINSCKLKD